MWTPHLTGVRAAVIFLTCWLLLGLLTHMVMSKCHYYKRKKCLSQYWCFVLQEQLASLAIYYWISAHCKQGVNWVGELLNYLWSINRLSPHLILHWLQTWAKAESHVSLFSWVITPRSLFTYEFLSQNWCHEPVRFFHEHGESFPVLFPFLK